MAVDVNGIGDSEIKATGYSLAAIITALGVLLGKYWGQRSKQKDPQNGEIRSDTDINSALKIMVQIISEDRKSFREERAAAREDFQMQRKEMNDSLDRISGAMEKMESAIERSASVNEMLAEFVKRRETTTETLHRETQGQLEGIAAKQNQYINGQARIATEVADIKGQQSVLIGGFDRLNATASRIANRIDHGHGLAGAMA